MEDEHKTKKQLISEVLELRQLVTALNATETESRQNTQKLERGVGTTN